MQKPSTIIYREFKDELQELINSSSLPAFVLLPVMRDVVRQLEKIEERQYQRDVEEWEKVVGENGEQAD